MQLKYLILATAFLFIGMSGLEAQKYGHLNLGNLLELLPERQQADDVLAKFRDARIAEENAKIKALEEKVTRIRAKIQELSPLQIQEKEKEVQADQQAIQAFKQETIQQLEKKRRDLLGPILEKIQDAVDSVAKENGYVMIFDTSVMNSVLFAKDADDVMELVKAKLGL